ncbi:FYVE, RhoGEF and PH domain-containing protein 5b [Lepisosteus oculatus]|uniref:FYVE, RhoGEF and PH domain containing 5 n=1 Tax=Lepisosteus oculatus TaxID=7918 RepID=W5MZ81_LEPOC|nr:PREDICTED: FYVE, RhoGEF and PH domain-containing protein 5 [Lepisosteus oculatus]
MNTDYKKPPLAPKPKILSHLTSKLPSSLMSKPCSSARGPKPPIAPKPKLLQDSDEKCCLYTNNSLNRCSNGTLLCSEEDFNQENESDSFQITGDGYILLSDNEQLTDDGEECDNEEGHLLELCSDAVALGSSDNGEELEEDEEGGEGNLMDPVDTEGTDRMECAEISNAEYADLTEPACCGSHEALEADDELSEIAEACDNEEVNKSSEHQPHQANEDYELVDTQQGAEVDEELSQDAGNDAKREAVEECLSDNTPAIDTRCGIAEEDDAPAAVSQESMTFYEETQDPKEKEDDLMNNNCEDLLESEERQDNQCAVSFETSFSEKQENEISVDFSSVGEQEILADQINDSSVSEAAEDSIIGNEPIADVENNLETEAKPEEEYYVNETFKVLSSEEQGPMNTTDNVSLEAIADVEEIQANMVGDTTEETIDSLQFSSEIQSAMIELMPEIEVSEPVEDASELDGSVSQETEDLEAVECIPSEDLIEVPEADNLMESDQDKTEVDADCTEREGEGLSSQSTNQAQNEPCAMTVPGDIDVIRIDELINRQVLTDTSDIFGDDIDFEGLIVPYLEETDTDRAEDTISDEHVYEEAGLDTEGENLNFISLDRKSIVTRTRSLSGKVPGYVPETVPEETGPESDMLQSNEYCTVALDKSGNPLSDHEQLEINRMIPSKPRRFILYPRSYSVEGRDMPMSVFRENDSSTGEDGRMKRKDDNLSLPCFIGSSGSFSQRSHLPSSGMSTPTSVVDIPPPFELAYITKKPITKSSPSLLIESDSADKQKKKKSSFKRFLTLKFKKKTENKVHVDVNVSSSRSSSESSHHGPLRVLELDRRSLGSSPQLKSRSGKPWALDSPSTFLFYKDSKRKGTPKTFSRSVSRVESFEDRSRPPFMPLPLTKPRSISFPNADTSDYENIPAMNSDYENIQIPPRRPTRTGTFTEFFEDPSRALSSANENDGYVDMSSFTGFESKPQTPDQESESAYTEPYNVCPVSTVPVSGLASEEDQGKSSGEEDSLVESSQERQIDGQSRAFYIAKDLMDSENTHVKALKLLHEDFRNAVMSAVTEAGDPVLEEDKLCEILSELPQIYQFHQDILSDLESRIANWEEYQRIADVLLSRRLQFNIFTPYITQYDRNMALLEECCQKSLAFSLVVKQFEQSPACGNVSLQHQLLKVIVRILQYRMLLTDYLNNLSPDSAEYEDTQAALVIVSEVADRANDSMRKGENLLRLVHIEYSVRGQKDLLQPGRVFVKEGTLMKVSRRNRQPRHLFLMNDVMLYTYPQQDGKYRLKNTLSLTEMKVSKPIIENVHNALKIENNNCSITLSASSCGEREDWYHALSRAISDHSKGQGTFSSSNSCEAREKLWMSLGEKAPTLVPVSHVMMCMNCASDFSLTLRRHHCHACGKIVCRACSRNKYPLKYLKDRVAKVCDRCYAELKKRGGVCPGAGENSSHQSNRLSGRPLSAVFQNIHPPILWKNRKSSSALTQVAASAEGSSMSGSLHRCKRSRRTWKKLFFLIKDKVLYTFSASEDKVASESLPLLGFTVKQPEKAEGAEATMMFQLYHKKTLYYTFKAEDSYTAQRWINAMEEATVL